MRQQQRNALLERIFGETLKKGSLLPKIMEEG